MTGTPLPHWTGRVVLVADDNSANLLILDKMLQRLGFRSHIARNGMEAVEATTAFDPDVILMDINMPEMDGLAAAKEIRDRGLASRAPIIAATAYPMPSEPDELEKIHIDAVLRKPIRLSDLSSVFERILK